MREQAAETYDRCHNPAGTARQLAAILASGDRTAALRKLDVPTVVIHGTDDPLVPFRAGAPRRRRSRAPSSWRSTGMGHDLPRELWPRFTDALVANSERAAILLPLLTSMNAPQTDQATRRRGRRHPSAGFGRANCGIEGHPNGVHNSPNPVPGRGCLRFFK